MSAPCATKTLIVREGYEQLRLTKPCFVLSQSCLIYYCPFSGF